MTYSPPTLLIAFSLLLAVPAVLAAPLSNSAAPPAPGPKTRAMTLDEARAAITLLDDAYMTELQEIHFRYPIKTGQPVVAAAVIRRVQEQMAEKGWPRARFLAVNVKAMNPAHVPHDDFERSAVRQINDGAERVERVEGGRLRVATLVPLTGGCATCHWRDGKGGSKAATVWNVPLK